MTTPVLDLLQHQIAARHCPGALLHVERAGQVLARHALGRIHPDSDTALHDAVRFRIASLTKPVVTVAALMLVDDGRLALDVPVGEVLPELGDMRLADGSRAAPTVRDLMRHTSGLAYPQEIPDSRLRTTWAAAGLAPSLAGLDGAGLLAKLAPLPLLNRPGAAFRYGYSTDVLGLVVERLEGQPLAAVLQQRLFQPLGMRHTNFEVAAEELPQLASAHAADAGWHALVAPIGRRQAGLPWMDSGGGGLVSTLDDYAAFGRMLADGGVVAGSGGGQRLVSERLFAELSRNQLADGVDGPGAYTGAGFGFGLGLAVRHDWGAPAMPCTPGELTWSGISGTALFVQPKERWFAVLMSANMASRMMARMALRRALAQQA